MAKKKTNQPARLQEALVLHKYILKLFGCNDLEGLSRDLKDPALEGVDDEGVSKLYHAMKSRMFHDNIGSEKLLEYDRNIVRHTNEKIPCDIRKYYEENKDGLLKGKEIYLLRNESRKGIGFFEANNFYPDFILWVNDSQKQHVTFIDPKGIRNLKGLQDPKIQLYNQLKTEVEPSLNDADIILDSYIISNTDYNQVKFWGGKEELSKTDFENEHVLFQNDSNYIKVLFEKVLGSVE